MTTRTLRSNVNIEEKREKKMVEEEKVAEKKWNYVCAEWVRCRQPALVHWKEPVHVIAVVGISFKKTGSRASVSGQHADRERATREPTAHSEAASIGRA